MALVFERIVTQGLGDLSYLIGDDESGLAAVIDPRADVAIYKQLAYKHKVSIAHILQTHIHEDFLSGAVALSRRVGGAVLHMRHVDDIPGYDHEEINDGDRLELGSVILTARATPGHTPEHTSYLISEKRRATCKQRTKIRPLSGAKSGQLIGDRARTDLYWYQSLLSVFFGC